MMATKNQIFLYTLNENQAFLNLISNHAFVLEQLDKHDHQTVEDGRLKTGIDNPVSSLRLPVSNNQRFNIAQ